MYYQLYIYINKEGLVPCGPLSWREGQHSAGMQVYVVYTPHSNLTLLCSHRTGILIEEQHFYGGSDLNRTCGSYKNLHVSLFLLTVFGPIYYVPP